MTVSKRTRFEVMRRDGFRCQYCGLKGTETAEGLTIDHVVPGALGGSDDVRNLVTACTACNAGKASVPPDAALVDAIDEAVAIAQVARDRAHSELIRTTTDSIAFESKVWDLYEDYIPELYRNARDIISTVAFNWHRQGIPLELVGKALRIASENRTIARRAMWQYACGIVRNLADESQKAADDYERGFDFGFSRGVSESLRIESGRDVVRHHIDGTSTVLLDDWARVPDAA